MSYRQGNIWYHFYNNFGMTQSWIKPEPPTHRANALPLSHHFGYLFSGLRLILKIGKHKLAKINHIYAAP